MWNYEKRLQFPVNITRPNAKIAQIIISQYGGPDGEAAASFRYLSQRYSMPYNKVAGLLTDIGTEELAHLKKIRDRIAFALEFTGIKRNTAGCLRPDPGRVIDIVRSETGGLKFFST